MVGVTNCGPVWRARRMIRKAFYRQRDRRRRSCTEDLITDGLQ